MPGIGPVLDEPCERTRSSQPPTSAAEAARSLGTQDQVAGHHESGPAQRPSSQHPLPSGGVTGGNGGAAGVSTVVSAAGVGVVSTACGVLDRLRRNGVGRSVTVSVPVGQTASAPVQLEPAPFIVPIISSAPAEQTPVIKTAPAATVPAPRAPDPQSSESAAVQDQSADDVYAQVVGSTNPIPNVLSTVSEIVPEPASVPAEPFTGSFPAFDDDEDEEADPEAARRGQRTTSSVLVIFFLMVIILLVVASYIVYQMIGIPFTDRDCTVVDTVPSVSAQENGGGGQQPAPQPAGVKPEIAGVNVANNLSMQQANNQQYLADGGTSHAWPSHNSSSPELLQSTDIEVKLKSRAKISEIDLQGTNNGGQVEVRATDLSNVGGGMLLVQGAFTSGSTIFKVDSPQEVDTIVTRVTQLPRNSDPAELPYKATVAEITIKQGLPWEQAVLMTSHFRQSRTAAPTRSSGES